MNESPKNKNGCFLAVAIFILIVTIFGQCDSGTSISDWTKKPINEWSDKDKRDFQNFVDWKEKQNK